MYQASIFDGLPYSAFSCTPFNEVLFLGRTGVGGYTRETQPKKNFIRLSRNNNDKFIKFKFPINISNGLGT